MLDDRQMLLLKQSVFGVDICFLDAQDKSDLAYLMELGYVNKQKEMDDTVVTATSMGLALLYNLSLEEQRSDDSRKELAKEKQKKIVFELVKDVCLLVAGTLIDKFFFNS